MINQLTDDDLAGMLPDYLNNNLAPELRVEVDVYLMRNPNATVALNNLKRMLDELQCQEASLPRIAEPGLEQFLAHANAHPLRRTAKAPTSWWSRLAVVGSSWGKAAFALALMVIVGQSAIIAHLAQKGDDAVDTSGATRSLTHDNVSGRKRGPVLNVEVAPDAPMTDVMAAVRDIDGNIVFGNGQGNILYIELGALSAKEATVRLKQSKLVLSIIEIPSFDPNR